MADIRIEHKDGSTDTIPLREIEEDFKRGEVRQARLSALRKDASAVDFEESFDEIYVEENNTDTFGGVLIDVEKQEETVVLTANRDGFPGKANGLLGEGERDGVSR